jgi:hypothetical protein
MGFSEPRLSESVGCKHQIPCCLVSLGFAIIALSGCGEVKVVNDPSRLTAMDPINEIVALNSDNSRLENLNCLRLSEVRQGREKLLSSDDKEVFSRAMKAHLAPLNYPVYEQCANSIILEVNDYSVRDLVIASRLVIDVSGRIEDYSGNEIWRASYRLAENAGSLPLDPISAGFGAYSAAQNTSDDSRQNGMYLAVRRLLMALPNYSGIQIANTEDTLVIAGDSVASGTQPVSLADAMTNWQQGNSEKAVEIAQSLYRPDTQALVGYQYGLMLEALERDGDAALVYSDTAISQLRNDDRENALKTLRRLDRLNQTRNGRFDRELDRALDYASQTLKKL